MDPRGKKSRKMESNGKWIRNHCSRSICWQCAKQKKSSARSSSTRTEPERCEAGRTRGWRTSRSHTPRNQTDFDWYSGRHRLWTRTRNQTPKNWCLEGLMSSNHIDDRVCRTFPWDLCSLCQMNPWIQQPCSSFTVFPGTLAYPRVFWIQSNLSQQMPVDLSTRDSVLCLEQSTKSLPCTDISILFVCGHDPSTHVRGATEGWDQKTHWGEAEHCERRQTPTEQEDQSVHQRQKKNETTRKDTADSGGIQRHQKFFMHNIWKEKNGRPEGEKWQRRDNHIQKRSCECLRCILQQAVCRKSAWRRSTRPSKPGNKNEHRAEKLSRRPEKWNTRVHTSWNTSCHW